MADTIREVVFGAEDGTVQNTALIAGMVGAGLSTSVIVIAGVVNAIAGVLSMSAGAYLSSKAERDVRLATPSLDKIRTSSPLRDAGVMAVAYGLGALVPLIAFMVGVFDLHIALAIAVVATSIVLFGLGAIKAVASGQRVMRAGLEMLVLAAAAGFAGYFLGVLAGAVFGIPG
ncbi:MAG: VIT1/CCC1 transporter family protein [Actinomycetia bacterium]|nr:VIT1/CCC1 transporter family protein [Actinomycetes bacterium]